MHCTSTMNVKIEGNSSEIVIFIFWNKNFTLLKGFKKAFIKENLLTKNLAR